jgi:hypothetical protein
LFNMSFPFFFNKIIIHKKKKKKIEAFQNKNNCRLCEETAPSCILGYIIDLISSETTQHLAE